MIRMLGALLLASTAGAAPIRVLIVDGYSNHDWRQTTRSIEAILRPTGLCTVDESTAPPTAASPGWDAWRPRFSDYDVVIQNCNSYGGRPTWPQPVKDAFERFVREGGGVFIFHSANNAFAEWPAYNRIIGLGWRDKDYGTALTIDDRERVVRIPPGQGRGTGHGARGNVVVTRLGDDPIHHGMPRRWMTPTLEVYYYARGPAEDVHILSYAHDAVTGMQWPIEWTDTYGKGRVYTATYGHVWNGDVNPPAMRCAAVQTLLVRAVQWLAKRPVTFPVPSEFPTADAVSVRPPLDLR